jgi:hypothetical protein
MTEPTEQAIKDAHFFANEQGVEFVILDDLSYWPDHWIERNPSAADRIIYSTLD